METSMSITPVDVVNQYLQALQAKDLTQLPLAETVTLIDPLVGTLTGKAAALAFLTSVLPVLQAVRLQHHLSQDNTVVTHWEAMTPFGTIPILEWFEIQDSLIHRAQAFFDPRPIVQAELGSQVNDS